MRKKRTAAPLETAVVRADDDVRVTFEAFPCQRYGILAAKQATVSPDALEKDTPGDRRLFSFSPTTRPLAAAALDRPQACAFNGR